MVLKRRITFANFCQGRENVLFPLIYSPANLHSDRSGAKQTDLRVHVLNCFLELEARFAVQICGHYEAESVRIRRLQQDKIRWDEFPVAHFNDVPNLRCGDIIRGMVSESGGGVRESIFPLTLPRQKAIPVSSSDPP